jgi:hypothetical protein
MSRFSDAARKLLEETVKLDNYEWKSEFAITHRAEGEARVEARAVLLVLDARGVAVPDDIRDRVTSCTDLDQLERWVQRAAVVDTAQELLD